MDDSDLSNIVEGNRHVSIYNAKYVQKGSFREEAVCYVCNGYGDHYLYIIEPDRGRSSRDRRTVLCTFMLPGMHYPDVVALFIKFFIKVMVSSLKNKKKFKLRKKKNFYGWFLQKRKL